MAKCEIPEADVAHIKDIIERYTPIVRAAGMWSPAQNAGNIYALAGAIIKDDILNAKAQQFKDPAMPAVLPAGSTLLALAAMSPRELDALQTRIMDKYKNNVMKG